MVDNTGGACHRRVDATRGQLSRKDACVTSAEMTRRTGRQRGEILRRRAGRHAGGRWHGDHRTLDTAEEPQTPRPSSDDPPRVATDRHDGRATHVALQPSTTKERRQERHSDHAPAQVLPLLIDCLVLGRLGQQALLSPSRGVRHTGERVIQHRCSPGKDHSRLWTNRVVLRVTTVSPTTGRNSFPRHRQGVRCDTGRSQITMVRY